MRSNKSLRWTIKDAVGSADLFLNEARKCADMGMGYAALMTAFPVILAIAESLEEHTGSNKKLSVKDSIRMIYPFMLLNWYAAAEGYLPSPNTELPERSEDFDKWMKYNEQADADRDEILINLLADVRNGLVHALSLPSSTGTGNSLGLPSLRACLVDSEDEFYREFSDRYQIAIIPSLLVEAISSAIHKLDGMTLKIPYDNTKRGEARSLTGIDWGTATSASGIRIPNDD